MATVHHERVQQQPVSVPSFEFVAVGDYETEGGEYRLYRLPGLWPPVWNLERGSELIIGGAATKHDAVVLFGHWYQQQGTSLGPESFPSPGLLLANN